jgi:tetratricopeptide (TPR) repeat protein
MISRRSSAPTARPREEKTDPNIQMPVSSPSEASRKPLVLGGQAEQQDADLWSIAQPQSAEPPEVVQSFEEALRRVDTSLERLVGTQPDQGAELPLIEPIIEAEFVSQGPGTNPRARMEDIENASDSAEAAKARRQRLLKRAMENLSSMPSSSGSGVSSGSGINASSASGITNTGFVAPATVQALPAPPSAADQQLAAQIEARFAQLAKRDPFLTLGLTPQTTKEQVKSAFLSLAKTFHPDRLPPSLPHLSSKMSSVFEGIRDAYENLYDDEKRAALIIAKSRPETGPDPKATREASDLFKMAEVYFKKRDYRQAEAHFAKAFAIDKSAGSLAAQGWAIYMDGARKNEHGSARAMMQRALSIDGNNDRAHYQLGVISRVEGDMAGAERHFREAVRSNPRHLEANQELRLIDMRRKKATDSPSKKGGGFFG